MDEIVSFCHSFINFNFQVGRIIVEIEFMNVRWLVSLHPTDKELRKERRTHIPLEMEEKNP